MIYLPVMAFSFVMMVSAINAAEKRGKMEVAIFLVLIGPLLLWAASHTIAIVPAILFVLFLASTL